MANGQKFISTDKDTQFIANLATNAIDSISLDMPSDWQTAGINKLVINELMLQCTQGGLDLELIFWRTSGYNNADMDEAKIITRISLTEGTDGATQIAGANQYYYKNPLGQSIEYVDEDNSSKIHVSLVNRDATAKNTAATGVITMSAGTGGNLTSMTLDGEELLSAPVAWNADIATTLLAIEVEIDSFTATSGWSSDAVAAALTMLAEGDKLGEVSNNVVLDYAQSDDMAFSITTPIAGALGNVVLTLGCVPYFS